MREVTTPTITTLSTSAPPVNSVAAVNLVPVEVTVKSSPDNIEQLLRQIQISGTVSEPPTNGTITLSTALGAFEFSLAQLPENMKQQLTQQLEALFQSQKTISATIQPGSPPTEAILLLPSTAATASLQLSGGQTQAPLPQIPNITVGTVLPAVVLPPDIVVPGQESSAAPTKGTAPTITTNSPQSNATTSPLTPQTFSSVPVPQTQASTSPNSLPVPTGAQAAINSLLQPGKELTVQIHSIALPTLPAPTPANPNQIPATVIGNGSNGQLILKVGDATLYVRAPAEAPVGTHLLVSLEPAKPVALTIIPTVQDPTLQALQQTMDALTELNPTVAQQFMDTRIPQPNAQLAAPLLFFLSALKQGDTKGWLGRDAVATLTKAEKLNLIAKLSEGMQGATATEHDVSVGEWKSYSLPLHHQGQWQTMTLHVHGDGRKEQDKAGADTRNQIRFLIDIRMSKLGPMQLDGLVRSKILDMIVRSEGPLPPGVAQDLRSGYLNTLETMGFTGSLSFQNGRHNWPSPQKEKHQSFVT